MVQTVLDRRTATDRELANAPLKDEKNARDNHVLACNFAKYSPI